VSRGAIGTRELPGRMPGSGEVVRARGLRQRGARAVVEGTGKVQTADGLPVSLWPV
jgi:hypothetical protein